jgi:D-xylose transport system permease protein
VNDAAPARGLRALELDPSVVGIAGALAIVAIGFDLASDGVFLTPRNLTNLAIQSSVVGIMAAGMVLVIGSRQIDLAVGSIVGVTGMTAAVIQVEWLPADAAWGWPLAVAAALAAGSAIGLWQGYWIAFRGVPAFIVTLAGLLIFRGLAYLWTDGRTVAPLHPMYERLGGGIDGAIGAAWSLALGAAAIAALGASSWRRRRDRQRHGIPARPGWAEALRFTAAAAAIAGFVAVMNAYTLPRSDVARGIPIPVLFLLGTAFAVHLLASRTRFGRHAFALGGNPEATALAGVRVHRVTLGVFALMGLLAGLAGVLTSARLGAGANSMGTLAELSVIAAAVIGGTSLRGGRGSVAGALLGAVFMQSLENGMVLLGVSSAVRQVCIGLVLLLAVWIDAATRARRWA